MPASLIYLMASELVHEQQRSALLPNLLSRFSCSLTGNLLYEQEPIILPALLYLS
jgi:hypothetical protein